MMETTDIPGGSYGEMPQMVSQNTKQVLYQTENLVTTKAINSYTLS